MVESWLISATEYITIDQYTTCPEFIYTRGGGGGGGADFAIPVQLVGQAKLKSQQPFV